jgi:hypothetical protein
MEVKYCRVECDGSDIFIIADDVKIAKRGHPGTPQANTWISLEPGWTVRECDGTYMNKDGEREGTIEIEYKGAMVH